MRVDFASSILSRVLASFCRFPETVACRKDQVRQDSTTSQKSAESLATESLDSLTWQNIYYEFKLREDRLFLRDVNFVFQCDNAGEMRAALGSLHQKEL